MVSQNVGHRGEVAEGDAHTSTTKDGIIYLELRRQILERRLRPGERLVERDLCRTFGVTRTPIRHALKRLEQERLVIGEPFCGCRVREATLDEVESLFEMREVLEGLAARRIAEGAASRQQWNQIRSLATSCDTSARQRAWARYFEVDREFHALIVQSSGNQALAEVMENCHFQLQTFVLYDQHLLHIVEMLQKHNLRISQRHGKLYTALQSGDGLKAENAFRRHIREARQFVVEASKSVAEKS